MSKSKIKKWAVTGNVLRNNVVIEDSIPLEENYPDDASTPVNAPLAVLLMERLIGLIPDEILYPGTTPPISQKLISWFHSQVAEMSGDEKSNASEDIEKTFMVIVDKIKKLEHITVELLRNSLAVTADKSTIMKALSQPGCEALRFYQCISGNSISNPQMLSFVMLAVDGNSNDLGYRFDGSIKNEIERIETKSFTAEYNKTSGPLNFYDLGDDTNPQLKPYVLLKYALNASRSATPQTQPRSNP